MATGIKARTGKGGRTVIATFQTETLRTLAATLPEGRDRSALEKAIAQADDRRADCLREERLDTPLSIESLAPLGWMMTGEHSPLAYGAIREGDFRDEGDGHWAYGPPGAFDREAPDVTILRGAVQAGVMSEMHCVYRLLPPTPDRQRAIADAMALEATWRRELPRKARKPAHIADQKGMHRSEWHHFLSDSDLEGLPEGAMIGMTRRGASHCNMASNVHDTVYQGANGTRVSRFRCDAILRPVIVSLMGDPHARTEAHQWSVGRRPEDSRYPRSRDQRPLSNPYDCVLGSVWAVTHNGHFDTDDAAMVRVDRMTSVMRASGREAFPLASEAEADTAALAFAIQLGMTGGSAPDMPEPIPAPAPWQEPEFEQAA